MVTRALRRSRERISGNLEEALTMELEMGQVVRPMRLVRRVLRRVGLLAMVVPWSRRSIWISCWRREDLGLVEWG